MFSFRTSSLFVQEDLVLRKGALGLVCDQTAWDPQRGEYTFETLARRGVLKRIFTPDNFLSGTEIEHVLIQNGRRGEGTESDNIADRTFPLGLLKDLDALVVEVQQTGCRYGNRPAMLLSLISTLENNQLQIPLYIVDKVNPAGRHVEGTALRAGYRSEIGVEGIPHRHGLTIGELAYYLYNKLNAKFPLHIISYRASAVNKELMPWSIPPLPHFPGFFTASFYSGQALWNGTNVSAGIGTGRPYELLGAPFMANLFSYNKEQGFRNWNHPANPLYDEGVRLRWTSFTPIADKWSGVACFGFQLLLNPAAQYNALAHNLRVVRFVNDNCPGFEFTQHQSYNAADADRAPIELLLGDKELIDYVKGFGSWDDVKEHIKVEEQKWIKKTKKMLLYEDEPLYRIK